MIFYRPIKPFVINQKFGEDKCCVDIATKKKFVFKETLAVCPIGYQSVYSQMKGHNGLDLQATDGQPVYAAREGIITEVATEIERGLGISIDHHFKDKHYRTKYWHLKAMSVTKGQNVKTGQLIGYADNTGYSTATHLHFEVKQIDLYGNLINYDNGFFAAIDPEPLLFTDYAVEVNTLRLLIEKAASLLDKIANSLRNQ